MTREATWSSLGTDIRGLTKVQDILAAAKLDYQVSKEPIYYGPNDLFPERYLGKFATVNVKTGEPFGIVGNRYTVCQNEEAFDFINYIEEDVTFVKAGQSASGVVYIIAEFPEYKVLGDSIKPYIIFQNGHDGTIPVRAAITPLRMVCQNQFNIAFKKAEHMVTIRHFRTFQERFETAKNVLKSASEYMFAFQSGAADLASIHVSLIQLDAIIERTFSIKGTLSPTLLDRVEQRRLAFIEAYLHDDNSNFRGTAWGLVNAFADYETHLVSFRSTEDAADRKFDRLTLMQKSQMNTFISRIFQVAA